VKPRLLLPNEQAPPPKRIVGSAYSFFAINGVFDECEIPKESYYTIMIHKFDPPPTGHSTAEDFDPVVHLEIV